MCNRVFKSLCIVSFVLYNFVAAQDVETQTQVPTSASTHLPLPQTIPNRPPPPPPPIFRLPPPTQAPSYLQTITSYLQSKTLCPNSWSITPQPPCNSCSEHAQCGPRGICCHRLWGFPFVRCCA